MIKPITPVIAFVLLCLAVGFAGGLSTASSVTTWYPTLVKPFFNPPNWIFGPVWTTLYILMGIAAGMVWNIGIRKVEVRRALIVFGVQLVLNSLWSLVFFGGQSILGGLVVIIPLWIAILITILRFRPLSKTASGLLIPYLLWVSFATVLNVSLWVLNN